MKTATIPNPSVRGGRRQVEVTDRALRYRANANRPPGPELCHYCGARGGRLDVEHIDGHEENAAPENLSYACRACNTSKGLVFRAAKLGRPTRQYNPGGGARSLAAWRQAAAILTGRTRGNLAAAIATAKATPQSQRAKFARQLNNPEVPTLAQYAWAVAQGGPHGRRGSSAEGAHDEAGAIIHATPKNKRREYARAIAAGQAQRGTRRSTTSDDEVPF